MYHQKEGISESIDTIAAVDNTMEEISKIIANMKKNSVRSVHFFFNGPSQIACKIGAMLSNQYRVICYHHPGNDPEKYYISFGFMEKSRI